MRTKTRIHLHVVTVHIRVYAWFARAKQTSVLLGCFAVPFFHSNKTVNIVQHNIELFSISDTNNKFRSVAAQAMRGSRKFGQMGSNSDGFV